MTPQVARPARPPAASQARPVLPQSSWVPLQQHAAARPVPPPGSWYPVQAALSQSGLAAAPSRPNLPVAQAPRSWEQAQPPGAIGQPPKQPTPAPGATSYSAFNPTQLVQAQRLPQVLQSSAPVASTAGLTAASAPMKLVAAQRPQRVLQPSGGSSGVVQESGVQSSAIQTPTNSSLAPMKTVAAYRPQRVPQPPGGSSNLVKETGAQTSANQMPTGSSTAPESMKTEAKLQDPPRAL